MGILSTTTETFKLTIGSIAVITMDMWSNVINTDIETRIRERERVDGVRNEIIGWLGSCEHLPRYITFIDKLKEILGTNDIQVLPVNSGNFYEYIISNASCPTPYEPFEQRIPIKSGTSIIHIGRIILKFQDGITANDLGKF